MKRLQINGTSFLVPALIGAGVSMLSGLLLIGVEAALVVDGQLSLAKGGFEIFAIQFIATLVGCLLTSSLTKENKIQTCIATFVIFYFLLGCITVLLFDGKFEKIMLSIVAGLAGCGVSALLSCRRKGGAKVKRKKRHYR